MRSNHQVGAIRAATEAAKWGEMKRKVNCRRRRRRLRLCRAGRRVGLVALKFRN